MGVAAVSTKRLSTRQSNGRVANAVADLLRQQLTVPEIYLKPRLPSLSGIDVLAVNHAGSGDIHGVEIAFTAKLPTQAELFALVTKLKTLPLHFKYLALPQPIADITLVRNMLSGGRAFDADGIGRIGLISYPASLLEGDVPPITVENAALRVRPERFLLRGEKMEAMERFLAKAQPDIRVRI